MVVLTIFPVILQTDINVIMLSIGGQGKVKKKRIYTIYDYHDDNISHMAIANRILIT